MSVDEGPLVRTLTVYEASRGDQNDIFNVDLRDDTVGKGSKPIEELAKLQLRCKLGQCTQLSRDLPSHKYKHIAEVLCKNINLFAWKLCDMCRNLPFGGRATRGSRDACSTKGIRAESPPMFI